MIYLSDEVFDWEYIDDNYLDILEELKSVQRSQDSSQDEV